MLSTYLKDLDFRMYVANNLDCLIDEDFLYSDPKKTVILIDGFWYVKEDVEDLISKFEEELEEAQCAEF